MSDELYKIEGWVPTRVAADASLVAVVSDRVYEGRAPQKTDTFNPFPCLIFALINGNIDHTMNKHFVMAAPQYKLVVADEGGFSEDAYAALARLMVLFSDVKTDVFETNIFNSWLEDLFTSDETDPRNNVMYKQKGGLFRIQSYPQV